MVLLLLAPAVLVAAAAGTDGRPIADFTADITSGPAPLPVRFSDRSLNSPAGWAWYFGDEPYTAPWNEANPHAGWTARFAHTTVTMPNGTIVLMGGSGRGGSIKNDVWKSSDNGATWDLLTRHAAWTVRSHHSSVVMPDGTIVLMGGWAGAPTNDTWKSTDGGIMWSLVNANPGWTARYGHSSVLMPDGSIILTGGWISGGIAKNDTWRSTDGGATWMQMTPRAAWIGRFYHSSVAMPDGSLVVMGGDTPLGATRHDVWWSTDNGATWSQMNASPGWSPRDSPSAVAMPDGSIVLMGGDGANDVWRSTDFGQTWTQVNASAGWTARYGHSTAVAADSSIILTGGWDAGDIRNDTWRCWPAGSAVQNPSHTYLTMKKYNVTLRVYNADGYSTMRKIGYINVTPQTPISVVTVLAALGFSLLFVRTRKKQG